MKRFTIAMMALIFAMGMPMMASAAMDHSKHGKEMAGDMDAKGGHFEEIGKDIQKGVIATVKVKAYDEKTKATMEKMGMSATHHVMVFFSNETTGEAIIPGQAAINVKNANTKPSMLMQMGDGFGADVSVGPGMSTFEIGTRFKEGEKIRFSVMFHNM